MNKINSICLLGFGEVGQVLAAGLSELTCVHLKTYDLLFDDDNSLPSQGVERNPAVEKCASALEAASDCDLVISAVTAAEVLVAAQSVAGVISSGTWYLDLNSVSPKTRLKAAEIIEGSGGHFVEAAVMSSIEPKRIASPMLMGGPHAEDFLDAASKLGFAGANVYSNRIGPASATKMCRSVIIKGLEALFAESLVAARHYGVENDVIGSLHNLLQPDDWQAQSRYMISRSIEHGVRRAEEMREVAATISDAGIEPLMSTACASRQEWASLFRFALSNKELPQMLDAILTKQIKSPQRQTAL